MNKCREVETCCEYMEEHRSRTSNYKKWTQTDIPKVRVLDGLNLYCKNKKAQFVNTIVHGLVDCGAGINLISRKFIGKLVRNAGKHVADKIQLIDDRLEVRVANEKTWRLNKKARVEFKVGGLTSCSTNLCGYRGH